MKIVEIVVSKSEKVNTGNYESKDYFCSLKADVEINEDLQVVAKKMYAKANAIIKSQIRHESGLRVAKINTEGLDNLIGG